MTTLSSRIELTDFFSETADPALLESADRGQTELLDYRQLYELWERQQWLTQELDFSVDREHWHGFHVVLMMENRSFDHYFGWHPKADARNTGLSYPDANGNSGRHHRLTPDFQGCQFRDPNHGWDGGRHQYGGGKMNGFVQGNKDGHRLGRVRRRLLPEAGPRLHPFTPPTASSSTTASSARSWPRRSPTATTCGRPSRAARRTTNTRPTAGRRSSTAPSPRASPPTTSTPTCRSRPSTATAG